MTAVSNEPNTAKSTAQLRLSIDKELFFVHGDCVGACNPHSCYHIGQCSG